MFIHSTLERKSVYYKKSSWISVTLNCSTRSHVFILPKSVYSYDTWNGTSWMQCSAAWRSANNHSMPLAIFLTYLLSYLQLAGQLAIMFEMLLQSVCSRIHLKKKEVIPPTKFVLLFSPDLQESQDPTRPGLGYIAAAPLVPVSTLLRLVYLQWSKILVLILFMILFSK